MFVYDKDIERVMQAKKREILGEMENEKRRILKELSDVDHMTLTRLREIVADYNRIEYMIKTKIELMEKEHNAHVTTVNKQFVEFTNSINECVKNIESQYKTIATPEMYGAKGDGKTDDTDAFNNMFKNTNNIMLNKDKIYFINGILRPYSYNNIDLNNSTILCSGAEYHIILENIHDVILKNGKILNDNNQAQNGHFNITIANSHDILLDNLFMTNKESDCIYISYWYEPIEPRNLKNITIRNCDLTCGRNAIACISGENVTIENNFFHDITKNSPASCMDFEPEECGAPYKYSNVIIRNNKALNCGTFFCGNYNNLESGISYEGSLIIENNIIDSCLSLGSIGGYYGEGFTETIVRNNIGTNNKGTVFIGVRPQKTKPIFINNNLIPLMFNKNYSTQYGAISIRKNAYENLGGVWIKNNNYTGIFKLNENGLAIGGNVDEAGIPNSEQFKNIKIDEQNINGGIGLQNGYNALNTFLANGNELFNSKFVKNLDSDPNYFYNVLKLGKLNSDKEIDLQNIYNCTLSDIEIYVDLNGHKLTIKNSEGFSLYSKNSTNPLVDQYGKVEVLQKYKMNSKQPIKIIFHEGIMIENENDFNCTFI